MGSDIKQMQYDNNRDPDGRFMGKLQKGEVQRPWMMSLEASLALVLETVYSYSLRFLCSTWWYSQVNRTRTQTAHLSGIHYPFSISATFTWFFPPPTSCQNVWLNLTTQLLPLHFIWSLFHLALVSSFCHFHPVLAPQDMGIIFMYLLLLPWPILKILAWTSCTGSAISCPCRMDLLPHSIL